jgi:hypothetical protein
VSAWPGPQNVTLAGVHDGVEALACTTTETLIRDKAATTTSRNVRYGT